MYKTFIIFEPSRKSDYPTQTEGGGGFIIFYSISQCLSVKKKISVRP